MNGPTDEAPNRVGVRARRSDGGIVAVVVALLLGVLGAFLALVMNVARAYDSRAQLLAAADSAALAGALELDGTAAGLANARARAYTYMTAQRIDGEGIVVEAPSSMSADQVVGCWNIDVTPGHKFDSGTFEPFVSATSRTCPTRDVNAVRVRNGRDGSPHNPRLETAFGGFVGVANMRVTAEAVAVGGGICSTDCAAPFALADCQLVDQRGALRCGSGDPDDPDTYNAVTYKTRPARTDSIGLLAAPCDPRDRDCDSEPLVRLIEAGCIQTGESFYNTHNGNNINPQVIDAMARTGFVNRIWTVPVLRLPGCEESPPNPDFSRRGPTVGFARVRIHRVCRNSHRDGGDLYNASISPPPPRCTDDDRASITLEVLCDSAPATGRAGCRAYNASTTHVRLVR